MDVPFLCKNLAELRRKRQSTPSRGTDVKAVGEKGKRMKREFIEGLLKDKVSEDEIKGIVDAVMDENGNDIENAKKTLTAEKEHLQEQLNTTQEALKKFDGVDADDLKNQISDLTKQLEDKDKEHAEKLADIEFNGTLEDAIRTAGGKNIKAVKAMLDIDALKTSKNQADDIKSALEGVKTSDDYLFKSDEPIDNPTGGTGGGGGVGTDAKTAAMRAAAGLPPVKE